MATRFNVLLASAVSMVVLYPFVAIPVDTWADTQDTAAAHMAQLVQWHSELGTFGRAVPSPEWESNLRAIDAPDSTAELLYNAYRSVAPAQTSSTAAQHANQAVRSVNDIAR